MHLHGAGQRNKGNSILIGLILAGAIIVVTIDAIIKIGWLALAPYGFGAFIVLSLLALMRAQDRVD
jgi:hypothetical protein